MDSFLNEEGLSDQLNIGSLFILSQSIKRQRAILMKWKSEPDGKRHLSPCGRKLFILTGSENGESSCRQATKK